MLKKGATYSTDDSTFYSPLSVVHYTPLPFLSWNSATTLTSRVRGTFWLQGLGSFISGFGGVERFPLYHSFPILTTRWPLVESCTWEITSLGF